jgi:hypothetical protein
MARLTTPSGIASLAAGGLVIADTDNNLIRYVDAGGSARLAIAVRARGSTSRPALTISATQACAAQLRIQAKSGSIIMRERFAIEPGSHLHRLARRLVPGSYRFAIRARRGADVAAQTGYLYVRVAH